jgi:hypothetical protein
MTIVTVNDIEPRSQFTANGTQTSFPCDWAVRATDDVVVRFGEDEDPGIGYTFDPANLNTDDGFEVVFNSPPASGTLITVYRTRDLSRQTNYGQQNEFKAATVNAELADFMLRLQELRRDLNRTVRLPITDPSGQMVLPGKTTRALKYLSFDANGNPATSVSTPDAEEIDAGSAGEWGSDYDLTFDSDGLGGGTDQTEALNAVLLANTGKYVRLRKPDGAPGRLLIAGTVDAPESTLHTALDISQVDIDFGAYGRIFPQGKIAEASADNPRIKLAANALAGATTLYLDLTVADNGDDVAVGKLLIIRGEKDASGVAIDKEEHIIETVTNTGALTRTITISSPGLAVGYDIEYPGSAWTPDDGTDKTRISIAVGSLLTGNSAEGARVISVADGSIFAAGEYALLRSNAKVSPNDPDSIPYGEEPVKVHSVSSNDVTLEAPAGRAFLTADTAGLYKLDGRKFSVIGGRGVLRSVAVAPVDRRIDWVGGQYLVGGEFRKIRIDVAGATANDKAGAGISLRRCYGVRVVDPDIRGRANTGAGDGNGVFIGYSTDCRVERGYLERCRHGVLFQGGNRLTAERVAAANCYTNAFDMHGAGEFYPKFSDCEAVGGPDNAPDSTQQGGATVGNTRWQAGTHHAVIHGCRFIGFDAGSSDFGIIVRPASTDVLIADNVIAQCDTGIRVSHHDRAGEITTSDIAIVGNRMRDVDTPLSLFGNNTLWTTGASVLGTATRPYYWRASNGRLYSTTQTGTTGATEPTHTSGDASDDNITWTHVGLVEPRITGVTVSGNDLGTGTNSIAHDGIDGIFADIGIPHDLADGSVTVPAGSKVRLTGTAAANVTVTIQDGTIAGQDTSIAVIGDPDGNDIDIYDAAASPTELVGSAAQGARFVVQWTGTAQQLVSASTTDALGPFATAATIAATSVTADDSGTGATFATAQAGLVEAFAAINAVSGVSAPDIETSNADPFALTTAMRASENVIVTSHQAAVDFDVPANAPVGSIWIIAAQHSGCTVSNAGGAGSVVGTSNLIEGRRHYVDVLSNPGLTAPVTYVAGGAVGVEVVNSTKTYDAADHEGEFNLNGSSGDQTLPAAANVPDGWIITIYNEAGGNRNIVGADLTKVLADDGVYSVKKMNGSLVGFGTGSTTLDELDAA